MNRKLSIENIAPAFVFQTPWDGPLDFYNEVGNSPVILFFLRYIGCPVCQVEMANIKRYIYLTVDKKIKIFVVLQSAPESVSSICNKEDWPFTIICDPQAKIFKTFFVEPGGIIRYLHPSGLLAGFKALRNGHSHGPFEGMETQLPATFVISTNKSVKYAYYGKRINDVPSLEYLVKKLD